jgi:hypothetical protein
MLRTSRPLLPTFFLCAFTVLLAQGPRPMTLVDIVNMPQVTDPQLSPDGRQILFVVGEANWKANRPISHIRKINMARHARVRTPRRSRIVDIVIAPDRVLEGESNRIGPATLRRLIHESQCAGFQIAVGPKIYRLALYIN